MNSFAVMGEYTEKYDKNTSFSMKTVPKRDIMSTERRSFQLKYFSFFSYVNHWLVDGLGKGPGDESITLLNE